MGIYNIAFVPKLKSNDFVKLATENMKEPYSYILGKASIPHITICQFEYEEDKLDELLELICSESLDYDLDLSFKEVSHLTFDEKVYWLSLLPNETKKLHNVFAHITKYVQSIRSDEYDPHLTLFNYLYKKESEGRDFDQKFNGDIEIDEEFELIIGDCDSFGQLTKIIRILSDIDRPILRF